MHKLKALEIERLNAQSARSLGDFARTEAAILQRWVFASGLTLNLGGLIVALNADGVMQIAAGTFFALGVVSTLILVVQRSVSWNRLARSAYKSEAAARKRRGDLESSEGDSAEALEQYPDTLAELTGIFDEPAVYLAICALAAFLAGLVVLIRS